MRVLLKDDPLEGALRVLVDFEKRGMVVYASSFEEVQISFLKKKL